MLFIWVYNINMKFRFDLDLLRTFTAICDTGGFTRAGERLHLTQSTVSLQLKRLEEIVEKRLFERHTRKVILTNDGEILLGYARQILEIADEAQSRMSEPEIEGVVRVGIPEDFANRHLPGILARFTRAHPKVQLHVYCDLSVSLLEGLSRNEFDLVLVKKGSQSDKGILVWREPLVWAAAAEFDVSGHDPLPLIVFPRGCIYRDLALRTLEGLGRKWWLAFISPSLTGLQAALLAGLGVTVLAKSALPHGHRILRPEEGFPDLSVTDLTLHYADGGPSKAATLLSEHIIESIDASGSLVMEQNLAEQSALTAIF
jgi:DNA-binding transcriptional LysR family regulator